jgi:hypothetical protein
MRIFFSAGSLAEMVQVGFRDYGIRKDTAGQFINVFWCFLFNFILIFETDPTTTLMLEWFDYSSRQYG